MILVPSFSPKTRSPKPFDMARRRPRALRLLLLAGVATLGLAGCGGSMESAAGVETASIPSGPASIDPSYGAGGAADRVNRAREAREAREDREDGEDLTVYYRRAADLAMAEGKTYGAAVHLRSVYQHEPDDKQVAYDLARHLRYLGALADAEQVINEALSIHPRDPLLTLERAKIMIGGGRAGEALAVLRPLASAHPNDPAILQAIGVAHDRQGDHRAAQQAYSRAVAAGSPSAALLNNYGLSHLLSGDLDRAIELLRRASVTPGAKPQIRQNLALALSLAGDRDEARRVAGESAPENVVEDAIDLYDRVAPSQHAWDIAADD